MDHRDDRSKLWRAQAGEHAAVKVSDHKPPAHLMERIMSEQQQLRDMLNI